MTPPGRSIQQAARSQAGSPAHMSPKSTTPQKLPSAVRTFAGCKSACSHRAGPVQAGAASASSQTSRTASGSETSPRSVVSFSRRAKPSPASASGRVVRRGQMQGCQEGRQGIGCLGTASRGGAVSRFTGDPGSDDPGVREPPGRLAQTLRNRYRQWQARRYGRQQGVLLEEQLACAMSGPGQPDREVVAESPQLVVPATSSQCQRQAGQVGVLFAEQLRNQIRGDLIPGARHRSNRSP